MVRSVSSDSREDTFSIAVGNFFSSEEVIFVGCLKLSEIKLTYRVFHLDVVVFLRKKSQDWA